MNHRGEIENLLYAYQERLDAGDLVGMAALFEHATVGGVDEDAPMRGSADVIATFKKVLRVYEDGTPRTTHTTLNPIIVVDEEAGNRYLPIGLRGLSADGSIPAAAGGDWQVSRQVRAGRWGVAIFRAGLRRRLARRSRGAPIGRAPRDAWRSIIKGQGRPNMRSL
jgi:SnoaL-like protein